MRAILAISISVLLLFEAGAEPLPSAEFPFELRDGLIRVQVTVPQSAKSLNFILDSGAAVSVLNLRAARLLGLRLGNRVLVRGVQTNTAGYWPQRLSATVGQTPLPNKFLVANLPELSPACDRDVDGLIGADFFRSHVVQIDYQSKKIRLFTSSSGMANCQSVALEVRPCGMRVPLQVDGGKEQWVRLDTGCISALHWVTSPVLAQRCSRQVALGVSPLSVPQATLDVRLGHFDFKGVPAGLHDKEIFAGESGLLGNGLLSRFSTVTIDAQAGKLLLQGCLGEN